jgi:ankyrin repeat protein
MEETESFHPGDIMVLSATTTQHPRSDAPGLSSPDKAQPARLRPASSVGKLIDKRFYNIWHKQCVTKYVWRLRISRISVKTLLLYVLYFLAVFIVCSGCDKRKEQLLKAAVEGDASRIEQLLQDGQDPNVIDEKGRSALALAAARGHVEAVRVLLRAGADPSIPSAEESAWRAAVYSNGSALEILLEHQSKLPDRAPSLAIDAAASLNCKVLRILIKHGVDAADVDILLAALFQPGISEGEKELQKECVLFLLDAGAPVNELGSAKSVMRGEAPLHAAAICNNWTIARLLLEHGANPEIQDTGGNTPADFARGLGHTQYLREFREWKANVDLSRNRTRDI